MMSPANDVSRAAPWMPDRRLRVVVGLLTGVGASGVAAGLGRLGNLLEVHRAPIDPSGLILAMPLIFLPLLAGHLLRRGDAVAAIAAGAVTGPIVAMVVIDGSCLQNMWLATGLFFVALICLVVTSVAALFGASFREDVRVQSPERGVMVLLVAGLIGILGWIGAVVTVPACP